MFAINKVARLAAVRKPVESLTFEDLLKQADAAKFEFGAIDLFGESKRTLDSDGSPMKRIVLGALDEETGAVDYDKPIISIRISNKIILRKEDPIGVFKELYHNYPLFYNERKIKATEEEIEDGADEVRIVSTLTAAPLGENKVQHAKVDLKALFGETKVVSGVPGE